MPMLGSPQSFAFLPMPPADDQFVLFPELPGGTTRKRRRPRLFFALWPDARVRKAMQAAAASIPPGDAPNASRVKPERYHLTLAFLGELDAPRIAAALRAGDAVQAAAFDLRLDTVGHFERVRVAWLGPSRCPRGLAALKVALDRELLHLHLPVEGGSYTPHVTSLRGVRDAPDAPLPEIDWPVREFVLIRNSMASGRSRYTVLRRWTLAAASA